MYFIVIVEKKVTKAYRENCWDVISVGMAVIGFSCGCVFWRLDKGFSKVESCCFIVISSGSICRNQSAM